MPSIITGATGTQNITSAQKVVDMADEQNLIISIGYKMAIKNLSAI